MDSALFTTSGGWGLHRGQSPFPRCLSPSLQPESFLSALSSPNHPRMFKGYVCRRYIYIFPANAGFHLNNIFFTIFSWGEIQKSKTNKQTKNPLKTNKKTQLYLLPIHAKGETDGCERTGEPRKVLISGCALVQTTDLQLGGPGAEHVRGMGSI